MEFYDAKAAGLMNRNT